MFCAYCNIYVCLCHRHFLCRLPINFETWNLIYGFPYLYKMNCVVYRSKLKEQVLQPDEDDILR